MTSLIKNKFFNQLLITLGISLWGVLATTANAVTITDLGNSPLVSATTGDVLPNLMYILDNSGSMGNDYMPDYVKEGSYKCKETNEAFTATCSFGDPAANTKQFNSIYYNPGITYLPGQNADGTDKASMTSANTAGWTNVPIDAYGIQGIDPLGNGATSYSLIPVFSSNTYPDSGYPDKVWCNASLSQVSDFYDPAVCRKNDQYIYPTTTFNNAQYAYGYPYYYTVAAGEYCTNKNLTSCITATVPTAIYTEPAKLRWCNSQANAAYTSNGNAGCQAKYIEGTGTSNYTFARWTGTTASNAGGIIKIKSDINCGTAGLPSCVAPSAVSISNITVGGVRVIPTTPSPALTITDTTDPTQRATLASAIVTAINTYVSSPDYIATAQGDEVTIVPVSASPTGTIAVTTTSVTGNGVTGTVHALGSFIISSARNTSSVTSITVGGVEILNQTKSTASSSDTAASRQALATLIVNRINSYVSSPKYTAVSDGAATPKITITASDFNASSNGTLTVTKGGTASRLTISSVIDLTGGNGMPAKTYTVPTSIGQFTGNTPVVTTFDRVDIVPSIASYAKASTRTDCNTSNCTYDQEMTNFANWFAYYRTRIQMMKTSTSRAFKAIDSRYRVGFITISDQSNNYVPIAPFNSTQKTSWYNKLLSTNPSGSTPLRFALSSVGQIYAGKNPVSGFTADPVQYSCQQNFALLTTDGYWNLGGGTQIDGSTAIGNLDGTVGAVQTPRPMYEGPTATSDTLADVSKYYYDTDLRTSALGNCTGSTRVDGTTGDVCNNNVFVTPTDNNNQQHMTTFTLGLGVDATLTYTTDYKDATSGDFYELKQGTRNWPVPVANQQTAVDDLWHAAVNGQGTYFSAKDPNQLSKSLDSALNSIKAKVGAGAAAATSTLNPVATDNFAYVASYTSVKWTGNLEARTINTLTGKVSEDATWCVEDVVADTCAPGSTVVNTNGTAANGNSTTYQCVTPAVTTAANCTTPGVYDATAQTCSVEVATSCVGAIQDNVSNTTDTRTIYMDVNGALGSFTSTNLAAIGKDINFSNAFLATNLSQWSSLTDGTSGTVDQRSLVNSSSLVNYLRGNTGYEDRASNQNGTTNNRLYRFRETVLGDLVDSTPVYVAAPKANFSDPGYSTFTAAQSTRAGTIYIGANDGMLHAINALNGEERWAYIPTMALDNMWKLADKNYGNGVPHAYFVDGDVVVNDVCIASCTTASAVWKTILVAGLNGGGKGYFALDVTDPTTPLLLWEFGTSPEYTGDLANDTDIGYSYGNPIITKRSNGTWVVLVTSGYNNMTGSNPGKGFLYVLDAVTGVKLDKYATGAGDDGVATTATGPSGLAKINGFVADGEVNNQVTNVYGGDLLGNLWRFDPNAAAGTAPFKLAVLKDNASTPKVQSITVRPELGQANGKTIVFVGTGRYLGTSDLADTQQQTLYAITDESPTLVSPRTSSLMVNQTLSNVTGASTRSVTSPNTVNLATGRGWYIDLPDSGERQNVASQLIFGTLLVPTTVPSNTVCSPGGTGWLNFLDYKTGAAVSGNLVSTKTNAPIVGINVLYVNGKPVVNIVTADNPTPTFPAVQPPFTGGSASGFTSHRAIWRELTDEQK